LFLEGCDQERQTKDEQDSSLLAEAHVGFQESRDHQPVMPGWHLSAKQACSIKSQYGQAKLATVRVYVDRSPDWQQKLAT